jgi:hypothetical protein
VPNFDSYDLVKDIFSVDNYKEFYLTNINWTIDDPQNATENGVLKGIDILDILLSDTAITLENRTKAQSLTGKITIDIPGIEIDEYELYTKYKKHFPNLTISYGEHVGELKEAYHMTFMSSDEAEATIHYEVDAPYD